MRRHAIDCKKIGESKTNPGYFKYNIKIREKDGTIKNKPAYGKDMQDAISRLIWDERLYNLSYNKRLSNGMILAWLLTVIIPSIISSVTNSPIWVLLGILVSTIIGFLIVRVEKFLNREKEF